MRFALLLLSLLLSVCVMAAETSTSAGEMAAPTPKPTPKDPNAPPAFEAKDMQVGDIHENESGLKQLIQPFTYSKEQHPRDPFRLPDIPLEPMVPGPMFGPFMEMHEVSLDQVQVKGIILNPTSSKAIISYKPQNPPDSKEKSLVVRVGDPLGENFGRVQSIRDGKIVILQTLEENGVLSTTTHVLSVRKYNLKQQ